MKRSEINDYLRWAVDLLDQYQFKLPRFGYWSMQEWKDNKVKIDTIKEVMAGWDITDFGSERFHEIGAVLYTVRNGVLGKPNIGSPYAEKYLLFEDGQRLPMHYHASKTEDVINRGGGIMAIQFYNRKEDGSVDYESDVTFSSDGIMQTVKAGEVVDITTGNSVRITPYLYHIFGSKKGYGPLIVGEVSAVNDDNTDNYWAEPVSRFADIIEDEPILFPLCNEYEKIL